MSFERSHQMIISDAGGVAAFRRLISAFGLELGDRTVRSWMRRNSIPAEYWKVVNDLGLATLEELAEAVAKSVPNDLHASRDTGNPQNAEAMAAV